MSESIHFTKQTDRCRLYEELLPQLKGLLENETDLIANLGNVAAVLKEVFGFFWVGFYLVRNEYLVLGPFQGSIACTRIARGKGVCGKAWVEARSFLVPDVEKFEGHIACSSLSRSEVVVPIFLDRMVFGVIDIDSDKLNDFDEMDVNFLEKISGLIGTFLSNRSNLLAEV